MPLPMPMGGPGARPPMPSLGGARPPGPGAVGAPPGPGSSPMMAPGGGAGNIAAAKGLISKSYDVLLSVLGAFPNGSKEQKSLMSALNSLHPLFGTAEAATTGSAASRQFINQGNKPSPLTGTPSPGIQSGPLGARAPMAPPPMAGGTPGGGM